MHVIDEWPYGANHVVLGLEAAHGNHGRGFGEAVALHHADAGGPEHAGQPWLQGPAAAHDAAQVAAQRIAPLIKDDFVGQRQLRVVEKALVFLGVVLQAQIQGPEKQTFLHALLLVPLGHNLVVHFLE